MQNKFKIKKADGIFSNCDKKETKKNSRICSIKQKYYNLKTTLEK